MASKAYEDKHRDDPDVKVHIRQGGGCELDGRTDQHAHTQADWREHIDDVGRRMGL